MSESISESDSKPEMAQLEIAKGPDAELTAGGLRFVACRREVGEIDGGMVGTWVVGKIDGEGLTSQSPLPYTGCRPGARRPRTPASC